MSFTKLGVAKFVASTVVGLGTGKIVGKIIKDHVTPETLIDKVTIVAASWAISGVVSKATKDYTGEIIDDVVKSASEIISDIRLSNKLTKINRKESTFAEEGLNPDDFELKDGKWVRRPKKDEDSGKHEKTASN